MKTEKSQFEFFPEINLESESIFESFPIDKTKIMELNNNEMKKTIKKDHINLFEDKENFDFNK